MAMKKYSSGAWQDVNQIKRYENGAWKNVNSVKAYKNHAWQDIWLATQYIDVSYIKPAALSSDYHATAPDSGQNLYFYIENEDDYTAGIYWSLEYPYAAIDAMYCTIQLNSNPSLAKYFTLYVSAQLIALNHYYQEFDIDNHSESVHFSDLCIVITYKNGSTKTIDLLTAISHNSDYGGQQFYYTFDLGTSAGDIESIYYSESISSEIDFYTFKGSMQLIVTNKEDQEKYKFRH